VKALLRRLGGGPAPEACGPVTIEIEGRAVRVGFRRHSRARRIVMRLDRAGTGIVLTLPKRVSRNEAIEFARQSARWITEKLRNGQDSIIFAPGASFSLRGAMVTVCHDPALRGGVRLDQSAGLLRVGGRSEHLPRRILDWLKAEARRDLVEASWRHARAMDTCFSKVSVRDQKSRWGSCAASGALSYSWRLVMAPSYVLDYVAAHEVAHLRHMNHGPAFWRLVFSHCPHTRLARDWLKANGAGLHRYSLRA
jgi:hypothetical protein